MEKLFIGIAGLIGAGKSTLAAALSKELGLPLYLEDVQGNEYLNLFYADMEKYAFPLQIYLLNRRFRQHQQVIWTGDGGVQDRTIYEDAIFAKMLCASGKMSERDYKTYLELFANLSSFMRKPNVIVFLDVRPDISLERITQRGREMESGISLEYLQSLDKAYQEFIRDISRTIPVIKVNWNEFHSAEEMASRIKTEYEKLSVIHAVEWH